MATQHHTGRAQAFPLALIGQAVPKLSRHELEALTERLIERLDEIAGDADQEDALDTEDDVLTPWGARFHKGPGCPIADAGGQCDEDDHNTGLGALFQHGRNFAGPGCPLADEDVDLVPAETFLAACSPANTARPACRVMGGPLHVSIRRDGNIKRIVS